MVNKNFLERRGTEREDAAGSLPTDIWVSPEAAAAIEEQDREVLDSREVRAYDLTAKEVDGRDHTYLVHRFPIRGADDEILGVGSVSMDYTERKEMEEAQRDLLDAISLPIVVSHADSNELL